MSVAGSQHSELGFSGLGPDTASCNQFHSGPRITQIYQAQGKYGAAEPLYKRSLAIWEKALGSDHPDVATSLHNLAVLYGAQGNYGAAEPLYKRSLAIFEKALGPDHPDVATSLEEYAALLRQTGREDEAIKLELRAIAIRKKPL